MPTQVRGENGRIIHDQLSDADAGELARLVHAAEGEVVKLVPFVLKGEEWVLDEAGARTVGAPVEEAPAEKPKRAERAPSAKTEPKTSPAKRGPAKQTAPKK